MSPPEEKQKRPIHFSTATAKGIVAVIVGPEAKKYFLHAAVLTYHSSFFEAAFKGEWKEAKERVLVLDDIATGAFDWFAHWIYTTTVACVTPAGNIQNILPAAQDLESMPDEVYKSLIQAYMLGYRLLAPKFTAHIHEALVATLKPSLLGHDKFYNLVNFAFDVIPEDRLILQWLVDHFSSETSNGLPVNPTTEESLPLAFLRRVMHSLAQLHNTNCSKASKGYYAGHNYQISYEAERCYQYPKEDGKCISAQCRKKHMTWNAETCLGKFS